MYESMEKEIREQYWREEEGVRARIGNETRRGDMDKERKREKKKERVVKKMRVARRRTQQIPNASKTHRPSINHVGTQFEII